MRISHLRVYDGKEVFSQLVTVEVAEFGVAIPDSVFTLAGLGLDRRQSLAFPEIKDSYNYPTWGPNGIDRVNTVGKTAEAAYKTMLQQSGPPAAPVADDPPRRWPYYAGAGTLAVVAGVSAVALVRRRRAAKG